MRKRWRSANAVAESGACVSLSGVLPFVGPDVARQKLHQEYGMVGQVWEAITAGTKGVVSRMLSPDPEHRISIDECLACPWLVHAV